MKAKTFENLIRKIVREEIDYALRREIKSLKEDLRDEIKPVIVNESIKEEPNSSLKNQIMGGSSLKQRSNHQPKQFVGNSTLNDLLNETAQGDTNLDRGSSPVSMEGEFNDIGGIPTEAAPKAVVEAVNRDYSGLMEAINSRKK